MKGMTFTHRKILTRWLTANRWQTRSALAGVAGGVSAAYTECQSFREPFFSCRVNYSGDSTDRTQQVSHRGCVWADGKSSRHKYPSSEPRLLCSVDGFTAACFNLYLFSFLLTVKHKGVGGGGDYKRLAGQLPKFACLQWNWQPFAFSRVWWLTSHFVAELQELFWPKLWHVLNTLVAWEHIIEIKDKYNRIYKINILYI